MSVLLEIAGLKVRYADGAEALRGVDLSVAAGQRVAVLGPNGAGKTSLLLAIMRGVPFEGRIAIDGAELSRRSSAKAVAPCGLTFQDPDDQLFMPTLLEDVAFGPLNQGCPPPQAEQRAREAIAAVGLAGLEGRCAHHLSGGQARCAALATILSMDVKLLLLDEPAANLDVRSRRRLMEILASRKEAMLLATHDLRMAEELCTHAVILDGGRVVACGAAQALLSDQKLLAGHGLA